MENVYVVLVGGNPKSVHKQKFGAHFAADQEIVGFAFDKDIGFDFDYFEPDLRRLLNGARGDGGLCIRDSADLIVLWEDFVLTGGVTRELVVDILEFPLKP